MDEVVNLKDAFIGSVFNARNAFVKSAAIKINEIFSKHSVSNNGIGVNNSNNKTKGGMVNVSGIILSGNGPLKSQLFQSVFLKHYILKSIIKICDVNYGGKFGFDETIRKCSNLIEQNEFEMENKLIENIFNLIANCDYEKGNIICIGWDEIFKALELNVIKEIVITNGYYKFAVKLMKDKKLKQVKFAKNENEMRNISKDILKGNDNLESIEVVSFVKFFDKLCEENSIDLKMVGMHSVLTQQFAKGLSGCVAVLHYPVKLQNDSDDGDEWYQD